MPRTVGILGGMGPAASALFIRHVIRLTPAGNDQEHLPLILISNPNIPDRTAFLLGQGPSPLPALIETASRLAQVGAELIAMPCNTAHYFWARIQKVIRVPLLNILSETADEIVRHFEGRNPKVGILGTSGTLLSGLYQSALENRGILHLVPDPPDQSAIHQLISQIKGGDADAAVGSALSIEIEKLIHAGAEGIILGCTELGLVKDYLQSSVPIFDSLEILAKATVTVALETGGGKASAGVKPFSAPA